MFVIRTQTNTSTRLRASDARSRDMRESAVGKTASSPPGKGAARVASLEMVQDRGEREDVPEGAESRDPPDHRVLDKGRPPERLAGRGIGEMDLDGRNPRVEERIA